MSNTNHFYNNLNINSKAKERLLQIMNEINKLSLAKFDYLIQELQSMDIY